MRLGKMPKVRGGARRSRDPGGEGISSVIPASRQRPELIQLEGRIPKRGTPKAKGKGKGKGSNTKDQATESTEGEANNGKRKDP